MNNKINNDNNNIKSRLDDASYFNQTNDKFHAYSQLRIGCLIRVSKRVHY